MAKGWERQNASGPFTFGERRDYFGFVSGEVAGGSLHDCHARKRH